MNIIIAPPPRHQLILDTFKIHGRRGVVFAYGNTIFNPDGVSVHPAIVAHESIHGERQAGDPDYWWGKYLTDPEFRLDEEVHGHRAEYAEVCKGAPRNVRRQYLKITAAKLADTALYGYDLTLTEAKRLLTR